MCLFVKLRCPPTSNYLQLRVRRRSMARMCRELLGEREVFVVVVVVVWWFESKLWVESRHFQKSFLRFARLESNCFCNALAVV